MIDQNEFSKGMTILSDRFNREVSEVVYKGYFDILNSEMDTEAFKTAIRQVFRHNRFFPSPQEIIEACRGNVADLAEAEWYRLMEAAQSGQRADLSLLGKRALTAVGGDWAVRTEPTSHLRREFLRAYIGLASSEMRQTPQLTEGEKS